MSDDPSLEDESFDINELQGGSDEQPVFNCDGEKITDLSSVSIKKYDFTNPIVLSDADLSKLKNMLGTGGAMQGEFVLRGQDLVVALQRAERNRNRFK